MGKRIRTIMASLLVLIFMLGVETAYAEEYETPHTLQPGDVISADVLNEIFDNLKGLNQSIEASDLVGSWNCTWATVYSSYFSDLEGASTDTDQLIQWRSDVITFSDDEDGTYSYSTSKYDIFGATSKSYSPDRLNQPSQGVYNIKYNMFYFRRSSSSSNNLDNPYIRKASDTRYIFFNDHIFVLCDKQSLPPKKPTHLSATVSDFSVTLTWTDNSTDETGFKIMRRDSLTGTYAEIGTVSADATSYTDTVTSTGKYWYRLKATNSNGDSLGSNVVKITVE